MNKRFGEITKSELSLELQHLLENSGAEVTWDNIKNKPSAMPADGGNSDTVGGLSVDEILNSIDKLKIYKSLNEISEDFTVETPLSEVITAMEDNSKACYETSDKAGIYKSTNLIVNIDKVNINKNKVYTTSMENGEEYLTWYHPVNNPDCEWVKGGVNEWDDIVGKPESFSPAQHIHSLADISDLQNELDAKAEIAHNHAVSSIGGLQELLDGKSDATHSHSIANIANLQTTLDGKSATTHTHSIANVSGLQTALDGKSPTHSHPYAASDHSHTGFIGSTQPLEIMEWIDFHKLGSSADYDGRLYLNNITGELNYVATIGNKKSGTIYHTGNKPSAADVGAAATSHTHNYAPNNGLATTAEAQAGSNTTKYMTPARVKEAIATFGGGSIPYGRIYTSGGTLSGSSAVNTSPTMRSVTGNGVTQSGSGFKFNQTGTYLLLGEFGKLELTSGGSSGVNLNFHLGGLNHGSSNLSSKMPNSPTGQTTIGLVDVTNTSLVYSVLVQASPSSSNQSFSISFGNIEYYVIKLV